MNATFSSMNQSLPLEKANAMSFSHNQVPTMANKNYIKVNS